MPLRTTLSFLNAPVTGSLATQLNSADGPLTSFSAPFVEALTTPPATSIISLLPIPDTKVPLATARLHASYALQSTNLAKVISLPSIHVPSANLLAPLLHSYLSLDLPSLRTLSLNL